LEWWRGEKIVYGKTNSTGLVLVAPIKEIVRIPKDAPLPLGAKRKRGSTRIRSQSRGAAPEEEAIPPALPVANPEEGWDDDTTTLCAVIRYTDREEVERRRSFSFWHLYLYVSLYITGVAYPTRLFNPKLAADGGWYFDKIFGDDDFIAAGQLTIPPSGRKPTKAAKDNTYVRTLLSTENRFCLMLT
jgi:centromere protein C